MWIQDVRFAFRQSRSGWGYTLVAIFTLALGIGANTALFTVVENVLPQPLSYAHPDRLTYVAPAGETPAFSNTSWLNYRDLRDHSQSFTTMSLYANDVTVVESKDSSLSVSAPRVTPNTLSMRGIQPSWGALSPKPKVDRVGRPWSYFPRACGGKALMRTARWLGEPFASAAWRAR